MAIIRATFFFKDTNNYGWSETIHNLAQDLTQVMTRAASLGISRRNLLGDSARLVFIRVSDDLVKRDSRVTQIPIGDQVTRLGAATAADIANTNLVVRMETDSPIKRRTLYMRGIPDNIVTNSGRYTPDGGFANAFELWAAKILGDSWALRTRDGTQPPHNITLALQDPATGLVTITTADAHGFALTEGILITGARGATQINGTFVPFSIPSATTFVIKLSQLIQPYSGNGVVRKLGYVLGAITDSQVMRVSHRIAGRPFDSPVGRRRARTRR